ncbi:hypothetical protein DSBG_3398 [Desulfosporosinus sp. BG]|nr:hypothetical protein DSBG_3398 [Desulfosporosinus sp. BG]
MQWSHLATTETGGLFMDRVEKSKEKYKHYLSISGKKATKQKFH